MEVLDIEAKELTKIINNLAEKPGGTLRFYGKWYRRPYDNYHMISECIFKDGILDINFDAGETIKIWNPNNIIFNTKELIIKHSTCVEFIRYNFGEKQTKENLLIDRYFGGESIHSPLKNVKVYKKIVNHDYPAVEVLKYSSKG
jgi:hypothetical protein